MYRSCVEKNLVTALNSRADAFWQLGADKIMFCRISEKYWGKSWYPSPGAKHRTTPMVCAQGFYQPEILQFNYAAAHKSIAEHVHIL